jgi:hypothetical protein
MKRGLKHWYGLAAMALIAVGVALVLRERSLPSLEEKARATSAGEEPSKPLTPPVNLRIHAAEVQVDREMLLNLDGTVWSKSAPTHVLLNRTPRVYQTEPVIDHPVPSLEVRAIRAQGTLFFRLTWTDATKNAPTAPERKRGEGGDPSRLYKRPTGHTNAFADAAAILIPEKWTGPAFPSLLMGDKSTPVNLYYWNASHGAEQLRASGRATPEVVGRTLAHRARHAHGAWSLTLETTATPDGSPLAFAIWDGQLGDRDGLKFFSIWYVLTDD